MVDLSNISNMSNITDTAVTQIVVDLRSRVPIYEQIINNVKEFAFVGLFKPDEQIPSIRQLTQQLGINPNTIQKAYAELERQGIIYTLAGRGAFISGKTEKLIELKRGEILRNIETAVFEAKKYFIPKDSVENIINSVYDNKNNQNNNKKELI